MSGVLNLKKSNCKNCYKCIRHCPVKSIKFSDNQAHIVEDECILCGQCFVVCPQNAKEVRHDLEAARALLQSNPGNVYVSLAPSFVANYPGATISSMREILQKLGFADAEETALGATIVKKRYEEMVAAGEKRIIISTCCHSVNLLIQKHFPEALPYVAPVLSPMQAHCSFIRKQHPGAKTVFIGPCISKKAEAEAYPGSVDCVLTFEELSEWMQEAALLPESENHGALENQSGREAAEGRARLFPTAGGILRTMDKPVSEYKYIAIDGTDNCIRALEDIISGKLRENCFLEMSACSGSCIGGPVMDKKNRATLMDFMAVDDYAGQKDFKVPDCTGAELQKTIGFIGLHRQMPGSAAIEEILHQMGKLTPEMELNCGSCGYNTCREKAVAVFQGKADLSMCLPFLKEKAESFSDHIIKNTPNGILVLNEALEVQQINGAARRIMNIKNASDVLGDQVVRIMDPQIFLEVLQSGINVHDKKVYLAEYGRFIELSVIYDRSYHILMGIMRDVTAEEKERAKKEKMGRNTIEITDKVIEKQMRVVQEIASLLGETTAETKIALTKLKESLQDE